MKAIILLWIYLILTLVYASKDQNQRVVSISYNDLRERFDNDEGDCSNLLEDIAEAFGPSGLGFLEISDIPQEMVDLRMSILEMAQALANLPSDELEDITLPSTFYTIGWSHGKEQFRGEYDTQKGSFYLNPFSKERINVFPESMQPSLEDSLMEMTIFMKQVGLMVAKLCDLYLKQQDNFNKSSEVDTIQESLQECENAKARLLYYFPTGSNEKSKTSSFDDWCGWHKDHGSLTCLLPGMLFGEEDKILEDGDVAPGLYIQTPHQKQVIHVKMPPTSIGIQLGETLEIQSAGRFRATPHAVKSGRSGNGRSSLALFLQPMPEQSLPRLYEHVDDKSLQERWRPSFGAFQKATTEAFH